MLKSITLEYDDGSKAQYVITTSRITYSFYDKGGGDSFKWSPEYLYGKLSDPQTIPEFIAHINHALNPS